MSAPQITPTDTAVGAPEDSGPPEGPRRERPRRDRDGSHARNYSPGFFAKLALMAVIDALGVYVVWSAWTAESYGILAASAAMLVAANWVYFSKRALPLKYILPGLIFLLAYQIFVVAYTGYGTPSSGWGCTSRRRRSSPTSPRSSRCTRWPSRTP